MSQSFYTSACPFSELQKRILCLDWFKRPSDFLIKITDGEEKCIIVEVKNVLVACDLNIQCNKVAQVLRQAQIIIQDMKLNDVTFVLTNSIDWSFWMAKKKGDKIEVA